MGDTSSDRLKAAYAAKAKLFSCLSVKFKLWRWYCSHHLQNVVQAQPMPVESRTSPYSKYLSWGIIIITLVRLKVKIYACSGNFFGLLLNKELPKKAALFQHLFSLLIHFRLQNAKRHHTDLSDKGHCHNERQTHSHLTKGLDHLSRGLSFLRWDE